VFEAEGGEVTSSTPIRHQVPVTDYLRLQARYAHLFRPEENTEIIGRIQAAADRNIGRFGLMPFAAERAGLPVPAVATSPGRAAP
jgi:pyruvate ferredoxin oxidoreductase beta subunit